MGDMAQRHPVTLKRLVLALGGMATNPVTRDVGYDTADEALTADVYTPEAAHAAVVILVGGYPDVGVPRVLGCAFKEMEFVISLAQVITVSGMAAVTYTTRSPATDAGRVLDWVAAHGVDYGLDATRVGLWATSGNVPAALALLMERPRSIRAAVLSNGFMLDANGTVVADAARRYGFVNACAGKAVTDLPPDVPLFVVRSGKDEFAGINQTIDAFVGPALAHNLPMTLVNHPEAPHPFEINHDSDTSRGILRAMLEFLRRTL